MKIIQLLAAIDGESPGTIGSQIYGLGDDGVVYELVSPQRPGLRKGYGTTPDTYVNGCTGGWKAVCHSDEMSVVIPHPLAQ
jgi:hypothetical protein